MDGPDLRKERYGWLGWEEERKVSDLGRRRKDSGRRRRGMGIAQWGEERGKEDQSEWRERRNRPIGTGKGRKGERREMEGIGRIILRPARPGRCSSSVSDNFLPIFPSNYITQLPEINSITFPFPITSHIWRDWGLKLRKSHRCRGGWVFEILPFFKQFLSISTTHSFLLNPRTKPKQWLGRRSCFGSGSKTPKIKGFVWFWWNWSPSRPNWPWPKVWKLLLSLRSSILQFLGIFKNSWIFRRVGAADRHSRRPVRRRAASGPPMSFLGCV